MPRAKGHISVGLPGRLSINGFGDFDAGFGSHRWSRLLLLASALLLLLSIALQILRPEFSKSLLAQPVWAWSIAGILLTLAASPRPRSASLVVIVLWLGFGVYFASNPPAASRPATARAVSQDAAGREASP